MSAIDDFRNKLSSDQGFADRIKSCLTAGEIIAVAGTEGIELTDGDLAKSLVLGTAELSDDELESVTVGTPMAAALVK